MIILVILIIFISIICLFKDKKAHEVKNNNPYQIFTFYKKENLERYKKYYLETNLDYKKIVLNVNIGLDKSFYTNAKEIKLFNPLMIVNKYNYVSKDFIVPNLVEVKEFAKKNMYLEKECMESFIKMAKEAMSYGLNLRAISTYRTYDYQEKLYTNYVKNDGVSKADTYSARPGFSEHHTGLAIDIDNIKKNYLEFENTKEFEWIQENAYKYGFILRYPKDKEDITGYIYEPWHYRYVGIKIASYIKENNISFEEYYYEFLDK